MARLQRVLAELPRALGDPRASERGSAGAVQGALEGKEVNLDS